MNEIWQQFIDNIKTTKWPEWVSTLTQIASVWYARKNNVLVYPTGIIGVLLAAYVYFFMVSPPLYADASLNIYYFIMSVYGWYKWTRKENEVDVVVISRTNTREKIIGVALFLVTILVVFGIYNFFDYEIKKDNYIDIFASGIFFTGMWYMALKKIENWTLWIFGDIIVTPIYAYRGLGMLSLQYLIFTILAISAYLEWRKILNKNNLI